MATLCNWFIDHLADHRVANNLSEIASGLPLASYYLPGRNVNDYYSLSKICKEMLYNILWYIEELQIDSLFNNQKFFFKSVTFLFLQLLATDSLGSAPWTVYKRYSFLVQQFSNHFVWIGDQFFPTVSRVYTVDV